MSNFKVGDIVVSLKSQEAGSVYPLIERGYINRVKGAEGEHLWTENIPSGGGSWLQQIFRAATLEEIKSFVSKGPHVLSEGVVDDCVFPKGSYVVLISSCNGENCWCYSMPINHVYILREESSKHDFYVEKDTNGSKSNGWGIDGESFDSKLKLRAATASEIEAYKKAGKPVEVKKKFEKGDYIVTIRVNGEGFNCGRDNYCFKIRMSNTGIYPEIDLKGSTRNGHDQMSFDGKKLLKEWRYATPYEIKEYNKIGKPYDVTMREKPELKFKVGDGHGGSVFSKGKWAEIIANEFVEPKVAEVKPKTQSTNDYHQQPILIKRKNRK